MSSVIFAGAQFERNLIHPNSLPAETCDPITQDYLSLIEHYKTEASHYRNEIKYYRNEINRYRKEVYREGLKNRKVLLRKHEKNPDGSFAVRSRLPEFESGGSQISRLSGVSRTDSSITSGINQNETQEKPNEKFFIKATKVVAAGIAGALGGAVIEALTTIVTEVVSEIVLGSELFTFIGSSFGASNIVVITFGTLTGAAVIIGGLIGVVLAIIAAEPIAAMIRARRSTNEIITI